MRFVVYDDESMEPITVLNLPLTERDALEQHIWRVAVPVDFAVEFAKPAEDPPQYHEIQTVDLWFEAFVRKGQRSVVCFTKATDLAMLLNPAWLPGQRRAVDYLQEQNDRLTDMLMRHWV